MRQRAIAAGESIRLSHWPLRLTQLHRLVARDECDRRTRRQI